MRAVCVFVVVLSAYCSVQSDAFITDTFKDAVGFVAKGVKTGVDAVATGVKAGVDVAKTAAGTAADWVGKHCNVKVSFPILVTPSCSLTRRRRDGEGVDSETQESLKATCRKIGENPLVTDGGFSFELVKDIFEDTDSKGGADGVLDATEYTKFIETLEVFDYCMAL